METTVLDSGGGWPLYILLVLAAAASAWYLWSLLALKFNPERLPAWARRNVKRPLGSLFWAAISIAVVCFLSSSMFLRFRAVGIASDHIELVYLWPRPHVIIPNSGLVRVDVVGDERGGGYLQISARGGVFRSVDFLRFAAATAVQHRLTNRGDPAPIR